MTASGNFSAQLPAGPTGPQGLSSLASLHARAGKTSDPRALAQATVEVEALFLTQLLEKLRQALLSGCSSPKSPELQRYLYLADQQVARALAAGGGLGLAQKLFADLKVPSLTTLPKVADEPGRGPGEPSHVLERGNPTL